MTHTTIWRLVIAGPAGRDIEALPEKYAAAVFEFLPALAANPRRLGKPLKFELQGKWVARRGPYRIVYLLDAQTRTINVLAVSHRADVYRRR